MSGRFPVSRRIGGIITLMGVVFILFLASATVPFLTGKGIVIAVPSSPSEGHSGGTLYLNSSFIVENHCLYAVRQIYYTLRLGILSNGTQIYAYTSHLAPTLPGHIQPYNISVPVTIASLPPWFVSEAQATPVNMSIGTSVSASYAYGFFHFGMNYSGHFTSTSIMKYAGSAASWSALFPGHDAAGQRAAEQRVVAFS